MKGRGFSRAIYVNAMRALAPEGIGLRPSRELERKTEASYFVSSQTAGRKPFFRHDRWAELFLKVIERYRDNYQLHAYVLMPDHFHILVTPYGSVERSIQLIKGGFSYRVKKELLWPNEVWQAGFSDHRIRDLHDWHIHLQYISMNAVKAGLCTEPEAYPYSSSHHHHFVLDAVPQRLKPHILGGDGGAEAPPLQEIYATSIQRIEVASFHEIALRKE